MTGPLLLLLVDALGFDIVSRDRTPTVAALQQEGSYFRVVPVLGYSDIQRAALFTGRWPEELGYWLDTRRNEGPDGPFSPFAKFGLIDSIPSDFARRGFRFVLSASLGRFLSRRYGYARLDPFNTPLRLVGQFRPTSRQAQTEYGAFGGSKSIFDLAIDAGGTVSVAESHRLTRKRMFAGARDYGAPLIEASRYRGQDLTYAYMHSLDMTAHRHGLHSDEFDRELRDVDSLIGRLVAQARADAGEDLEVLIVSDHGLNQTTRFVDFSDLVEEASRDRSFLVALDSTMVRIWYTDSARREHIRATVCERAPGHFLTEEERASYRIRFASAPYGEDIYLLDPGCSIFPNYHSLLRPYSMHAYAPHLPDQAALAIGVGPAASRLTGPDQVDMVDLFEHIISLLGVKHADHKRQAGAPSVEDAR